MSDNYNTDGLEDYIHNDPNPLEDLRQEIEDAMAKEAAAQQADPEAQVSEAPTNTPASEAGTEEIPAVEASPQPINQSEDVVDLDKLLIEKTNGEFNDLENLFNELKRLRESEPKSAQFKDDFIKGVVDYYEATGDLTPYLQAKLVNYDDIDAQTILREELKKQYPSLSDKAFDRVYREEILDKYKVDPDRYDSEDVEVGLELLNARANEVRTRLKDEQQKFAIPQNGQPSEDLQAQAEAAAAEWKKTVDNHDATKAIMSVGKLSIDNGTDSPFAFEIANKDELVKMTLDNNEFFNLFNDHKGGVDLERWYRVLAYASNPQAFEKSLIQHGKSLGEESVTQELKNPSIPVREKPSDSVSGDFKSQLLHAFLNRK